jgi:uncharacterized protein YihD (DUF1040 family)
MRDPKRIDTILKMIEKAWKKEPDLRFHQLLHALNLTNWCNHDVDKCMADCDLFYIEDTEVMKTLQDDFRSGLWG